jgi:DNA-binding SARP family transcriptional activator/streptogramin lyase
LEFRILGPLEVVSGNGASPLALGGAKQRTVLALLILHRGELVSIDRLVDELWGERAPPTAAKTLQGYVSRLRKIVGADVLETQGHGYRLAVSDDAIDAVRFERLVSQAREVAAEGNLDAASRNLDEALRLWRGAPLADLAFEPSMRTEAARLEELHVAAVEDHLDVELARGRDSELLPELEALVRDQPLHERARGQHMLALYRSGRQAEALASYGRARRALVEELGLEPGPWLHELERGILSHDPALGRPHRSSREGDNASPGRLIAAVGCILLAVAIGAALLKLGQRDKGSIRALLRPNAVGVIDPRSGELTGAIPVPGAPARLVAAAQLAWVGSDETRTLSALDPRSGAVRRRVATGSFSSDLARGEGAMWALDREHGSVLRLNRDYAGVERRIHVGGGGPFPHDRNTLDPWSVAAGAGGVWVTDGSRKLTQIDPRRGRVARRIAAGRALDGVTVWARAIWAIAGRSASVLRIDPRRGVVTDRLRIVGRADYRSPYPIQIDAGAGSLWVLNANTGTVSRIDPRQLGVTATIHVGADHVPLRLAVGRGAVWIANRDGTLARIDARTNSVHRSVVAHSLNDVAVADEHVLATGAAG